MAGEITFIGGGYLRTAPQYTPGSAARVSGGVINALQLRSGTLRIAGTVYRDRSLRIPSARRVVLLERDTIRVVRGQYSKNDGSYGFENVDAYTGGYIVQAIDQLNQYKAESVDVLMVTEQPVDLLLSITTETIYPVLPISTQFPSAP